MHLVHTEAKQTSFEWRFGLMQMEWGAQENERRGRSQGPQTHGTAIQPRTELPSEPHPLTGTAGPQSRPWIHRARTTSNTTEQVLTIPCKVSPLQAG